MAHISTLELPNPSFCIEIECTIVVSVREKLTSGPREAQLQFRSSSNKLTSDAPELILTVAFDQ